VATDLPETGASSDGAASPPPRPASKRVWPILRVILFLLVLGAATFGLSNLTRSVVSILLSVLLTMLWLAGIYWLLNAARGREGPFAGLLRAISRVVLALRLSTVRHLSTGHRHPAPLPRNPPPEWTDEMEELFQKREKKIAERFRKQQEQSDERHRELMEAISQLRRTVEVPRWKRVLTAGSLLVITTVASWAMAYYVPAPPAAATPIVTPSNTHTSQPSPSNS
jgi:hypothetical protein